MKSKDTAIKEVKGFSSAYPNMCNLKLLPNIDGTWITIQDDVGTSMTIKLSDLSDFICCGDCISRQKALDCFEQTNTRQGAKYAIETLPSVTPQRPKGKWIYNHTIYNWVCSECNNIPRTVGYVGTADFMKGHFKYCNHCGALMEVEDADCD